VRPAVAPVETGADQPTAATRAAIGAMIPAGPREAHVR
jgi:hypothetical protein